MEIPSLKITFSDKDRREILWRIGQCLETGQLSQNRNVLALENEFSKYTGIAHVIAMNSATAAITAVMKVLGVEGKDVLVPTNTFVATATGVINAGGHVKLMDTDPQTFSVTLDEIKRRVTEKTAGVIIVHIGGIITPEIEKIQDWCEKKGIWLFEDAAHAQGSVYNGKQPGSFGVAAAYSLFATKIITSGEGGLVVTRNSDLAEKLRSYRNHGKPFEWVSYCAEVGDNYRMSDITAAIALNQVKKIDVIIDRRTDIANWYLNFFEKHAPYLKILKPYGRSGWYKFIVMLPDGVNRAELKDNMKRRGIGMQGEVYELPLHRQPVADKLMFTGQYDNADRVCSRHICLPIYPELANEVLEKICSAFVNELRLKMG